jgi:hypothetical protein
MEVRGNLLVSLADSTHNFAHDHILHRGWRHGEVFVV